MKKGKEVMREEEKYLQAKNQCTKQSIKSDHFSPSREVSECVTGHVKVI